MMMTKVGIDYSMTSPAICVGEGTFTSCRIQFLTPTKKFAKSYLDGKIKGSHFGTWPSEEFRYDYISNWIIGQVPVHADIILEGYAFAAKGQVFNIGENTGLLKHKLYKQHQSFTSIPPTVIKKYATGKGNANKDLMYESFTAELLTPPDLQKSLQPKSKKLSNPVTDLVDAYFIAKWGWEGFVA